MILNLLLTPTSKRTLVDLFSVRLLLLITLFVVRLGVLKDTVHMPVVINDVLLAICLKWFA